VVAQQIPILPQSLTEAVDAFSADPVLRGAIGENLAQEFIRLKRMEWVEYSRHVSKWETDRIWNSLRDYGPHAHSFAAPRGAPSAP
jgi:glutamine synthetase